MNGFGVILLSWLPLQLRHLLPSTSCPKDSQGNCMMAAGAVNFLICLACCYKLYSLSSQN